MPQQVVREPYRSPALPAEERVRDLLSRMTLEEKAAQMVCVRNLNAGDTAELTNAIQEFFLEESRNRKHVIATLEPMTGHGQPEGVMNCGPADISERVLRDVFFPPFTAAASEVVQLYIRDRVSSVTRPVKELKGFREVWLDSGETATAALAITPDALSFAGIGMQRMVAPGGFDVMVGTSSQSGDLTAVRLTVV